MRVVFDLDDTISVTENRDYVHAKPIDEVVQKIRKMKSDGWEVVIHSSRGQISCKGDLRTIEEKNRTTVENWLSEHDVPYDELVFGKPIGDLYVDDKGMSLSEFKNAKIERLNGGGSRKEIYRIGNFVKKDLGSPDEVRRFKEWIADSNGSCLYPNVSSYLYSGVYMDYIDGERLVDTCSTNDLCVLILTIWKFRSMEKEVFTLKPQMEILEANGSETDVEWNDIVRIALRFLKENEEEISKHASYSHGDLILSNVLKHKEGSLYLID